VHIIPSIVVIPVDLNANLVGVGGSATAPFTVDAAPWSSGSAEVRTASGTFQLSGSLNPLTLVTPVYISALGNVMPVFLTLDFPTLVPEPSTGLLMVSAGIAGLLTTRRGGRGRR
jgi:hypothetical protein